MLGDLKSDTGVLLKRVCKSCHTLKRADCFSLADRFGNRRGVCKSCIRYSSNKEEWVKKWLLKRLHKDGKKQCSMCNGIKLLNDFPNDSKRGYFNKKSYCKSCHLKMKDDYLKRNPQKRAKWNREHKARYKDRYNQKFYDKLNTDPAFKMTHSLRVSLNKILKRRDIKKSTSVVRAIGCTQAEFVAHIESQFYPNKETGEMMTWENHGVWGWHLDHIKPLCSFNLSDPKEVKLANHYTNLQPLWAKENIRKGGKYN